MRNFYDILFLNEVSEKKQNEVVCDSGQEINLTWFVDNMATAVRENANRDVG